MNNETWQNGRKSRNKGGKLVPALCNIAGTLILVAVIVFCLPVTLAKLCGYEVYNVIAFRSEGSVIAHRVVRNRVVEGEFVTKGDANQEEDMNPVNYRELVGKVGRCYPVMGHLLFLYTSGVGKAYMLCFAACGAMLNILAGRLRENRQ